VKLMESVHNTARRKHLAQATEKRYTYWIKRFILYHGKRHPATLEEQEIEGFLHTPGRGATSFGGLTVSRPLHQVLCSSECRHSGGSGDHESSKDAPLAIRLWAIAPGAP
jgi:hypothetical protein